ncbi:hypothetical protein NP233_g84 [Leucocoprinus birnbaumii]|uniref:BAH domain-containing protein n=1 Tax=Leucocoprinus birnbaumii TaxID=56174 RepID=A0AAD5W768_9AGAR|nr:hypothetical protein NP233_g84 [Leucocoprinus birnbaumii]
MPGAPTVKPQTRRITEPRVCRTAKAQALRTVEARTCRTLKARVRPTVKAMAPTTAGDQVPTITMLRRPGHFTARPGLFITQPSTGDFLSVRGGDVVFVRPPDASRETPDTFWKLRVNDIYRGEKKPYRDQYFLLGTWYYAREDLQDVTLSDGFDRKEIVTILDEMELLSSNHQDVISSSTVEDACRLYNLDTKGRSSLTGEIPHDRWYSRFNLNITFCQGKALGFIEGLDDICSCHYPHNPRVVQERFCGSCCKWFHFECCRPNPDSPSSPSRLIDRILTIPCARGKLHKSQHDWELTGTAQNLDLIRTWYQENPDASDRLVKDKMEEISFEFFRLSMQDLTEKRLCPVCGTEL